MTDSRDAPDGFLARWSQRKVQVREGTALPPEPAHAATASTPVRAEPTSPAILSPSKESPPAASASFDRLRTNGDGTTGASTSPARTELGVAEGAPAPGPATPTLDDAAQLQPGSDFRRFVAPDVTPEVKNAALKKLFTDPHFNLMDGLDTYIDDYGKPDPIPASMLRQMVQSHALGLFADEDKDAAAPSLNSGATPDGPPVAVGAQSAPEPLTLIDDDHHAALRLQPIDATGPPGAAGGAGQDAGRER